MKESGVLGGSMLGTTFLQASTNAESAEGAAGRTVESDRAEAPEMARTGRRRKLLATRRIMVEEGSGIARLSQGRREWRRGMPGWRSCVTQRSGSAVKTETLSPSLYLKVRSNPQGVGFLFRVIY